MAKRLRQRARSAPSAHETSGSLPILAMHGRDAILEAIAESARILLHSSEVMRSIPKVLEYIGIATDVQRVHLLGTDLGEAQEDNRIVDHQVWSAPGVVSPAGFLDGRGSTLKKIGFDSWTPRLMRGETIAGNSLDFEKPVQQFLALGGVRSTLAVPIFVVDRWWGLIAFDECRAEREWFPAEIEFDKNSGRIDRRGIFPGATPAEAG